MKSAMDLVAAAKAGIHEIGCGGVDQAVADRRDVLFGESRPQQVVGVVGERQVAPQEVRGDRAGLGGIGGQPPNWAIRLLHSSWLNAIILIVARCAQSVYPLAAVLDATLVVNFDVVSIKKDDTNDHQK